MNLEQKAIVTVVGILSILATSAFIHNVASIQSIVVNGPTTTFNASMGITPTPSHTLNLSEEAEQQAIESDDG